MKTIYLGTATKTYELLGHTIFCSKKIDKQTFEKIKNTQRIEGLTYLGEYGINFDIHPCNIYIEAVYKVIDILKEMQGTDIDNNELNKEIFRFVSKTTHQNYFDFLMHFGWYLESYNTIILMENMRYVRFMDIGNHYISEKEAKDMFNKVKSFFNTREGQWSLSQINKINMKKTLFY